MNDENKPLQNITGYVPLIRFNAHNIMLVIMNVIGKFLEKEENSIKYNYTGIVINHGSHTY